MATRCINYIRNIKTKTGYIYIIRNNSITTPNLIRESSNLKEFKTENKITYLEDPNTFGTLSRTLINNDKMTDEGDIQEDNFQTYHPLPSQKMTTKQYADLIKQHLKYKQVKEAIDVLEIRMLKEDKVQPENYIYNILIGACADVGYTKKAFKLYNDMKRRALKPTGDTYTCLFEACMKSPWKENGLKLATHLRNLMIEKGIEPNLTNYNVMIKTFGRCGDLQTAFKLIDEMISKKIKIRVHTFNHLLHACISDEQSGLRHALIVWRKMLNAREKPNLYSFNLMLKCVKDCKLGTNENINELIGVIRELSVLSNNNILHVDSKSKLISNQELLPSSTDCNKKKLPNDNVEKYESEQQLIDTSLTTHVNTNLIRKDDDNQMNLNVIEPKKMQTVQKRLVPNLLSRTLQLENVYGLKNVVKVQDRFALVGGQDDFLKEMEAYLVKPDIKTFTQMIMVIDDTAEAEDKLLSTINSLGLRTDISFYNMLIKKRCLRLDYDSANAVKNLIKEYRKNCKKHPWNKKYQIKENLITYGVLAMACPSKEDGEKLLNEMKEKKLKVNIEILSTLLKHGTTRIQFGYILYIMNIVIEEKLRVNDIFLKRLEDFNEKCSKLSNQKKESVLHKAYSSFSKRYKDWLKEINIEEGLKSEHPWQQFQESHPKPVQKENIEIKEPKRTYKRNRKYVHYVPKL
ncbi:unnamed protein product [Leptidea sinapis]|uniref:Pentacotripeptide-repeat region of PRORP domain-containing protein n=1 Tax=Leptidea sinapis TaxID=189913 RepID=A0A5E4QCZ3_9NEOP|nr:unnamed protein product [Leptidea sinapis]